MISCTVIKFTVVQNIKEIKFSVLKCLYYLFTSSDQACFILTGSVVMYNIFSSNLSRVDDVASRLHYL